MAVDPATAPASFTLDGRTYYFCCPSCRQRFEADPERYLGKKSPAPPAPPGAVYTCPMHPEVVSDHPGTCPKCGMALEPRTVTAEEAPNPELVDLTRRLWVGVGWTVPLLVLAMGGMQAGAGWMPFLNWVQLALATPVVFWCGWPFFARAWASLRNRSPNMFTLIALGVAAAYLYSLV